MFAKRILCGLAAATLAVVSAPLPAAAEFPEKPIRLIVPFAPGGGTDIVARHVAQGMTEDLGQQIVVENHGGGGTVIGTEITVNAPKDGYTIGIGSTTLSINPAIRNDLPYDTLADLQPVTMLSRIPYVLVASKESGITSLSDILEKAKAEPGTLRFASPGVGSGGHLSMELLALEAGIKLAHIPYKGASQAQTDLLGGHVDIMLTTILSVISHVSSGALVPVAVSTAERSASLPDVPTIAESGLPGFDASSWNGVFAPAGTPEPVLERLHVSVVKALTAPNVVEALEKDGASPNPMSPEDFRAFVSGEIDKWTRVVSEAGITVD